MRRFRNGILFAMTLFTCAPVQAHQAPYSIAYLDVAPDRVSIELQVPISELGLALGLDLSKESDPALTRMKPFFESYFLSHTRLYQRPDSVWPLVITDFFVQTEQQPASGPAFRELRIHMLGKAPTGAGTRAFTLAYDGVVHQVINHIIFVAVRSDWQTGRSDSLTATANPLTIRIGGDNTVHPLQIDLDEGSYRSGFSRMVKLGMQHIAEGTDHLLFVIALILPAMLIPAGNRWGRYAGMKRSSRHILKIVTAFTIGHSLTLLLSSMGWVKLPSRPVEILIAFSILVSAIHAIKPLFAGKEMYIAAGFGLIHGLAFATVLTSMHLPTKILLLSVFGFNVGIELMQLMVILSIIPWLMLLSAYPAVYRWIRLGGAGFAGVAAIGWMTERISGQGNAIGEWVQAILSHGSGIVIFLAVFALLLTLLNPVNKRINRSSMTVVRR